MEKFAIDLDRVLDEFELNEDRASTDDLQPVINSLHGLSGPLLSSEFAKLADVSSSSHLIFADSRLDVVSFDPPPPPFIISLPSSSSFAVSDEDEDDSIGTTIDLDEADFCAAAIPTVNKTDDEKDDGLCHLSSVSDIAFSLSPTVDLETESVSPVPPEDGHSDDVTIDGVIEAGVSSRISEENSSVPQGASIASRNCESGSCIKVLHCDDEVINRDYLVTFGRKVDLNRTSERQEAEQKETEKEEVEEENAETEVDGQDVPILCDLVGEFEEEEEKCRRDERCTSESEEVCVTLDDDSGDSAVDMAPVVGFGTFVDVTEDDLDLYLQEEESEKKFKETLVSNEVIDTVQCSEKNSVISSEDMNKKIVAIVEVAGSELTEKRIEMMVSEEEEEELTEEATISTIALPLIEDDYEHDMEGDDDFFRSLPSKPTSVYDETVLSFNDERRSSLSSESDRNVYTEESGGGGSVVNPETTLVDAETDEGYEAGETSPSDHFLPFGDRMPSSDELLRIERPTSLYLPGRIDYEEPNSPSEFRITEVVDEERHFATLVSTAGSPEAVVTTPLTVSDHLEDEMVQSISATEAERMLGKIAPVWVPDAEAPTCMQCEARFTLVKRRHHCRACGKVLCASCCGTKARLCYMDNKEARVCVSCVAIMKKVESAETQMEVCVREGQSTTIGAAAEAPFSLPHWTPNPNNPSEYCSVIPPLQQAQPNAPPPTVMVPVGVLKRGSGKSKGEPKQVMFSDGIRPGGDLTELDGPEVPLPSRRQARIVKKVEHKNAGQVSPSSPLTPQSSSTAHTRDYALNDTLDMNQILPVLFDECADPIAFSVSKNLRVLVKIINLDCCFHRMCWSFTTRGMSAVGQDEIVVLLEMLPDERVIPMDVVRHLSDVYDDAGKGVTVSGMGHNIFTQSFLGSREHGGFLYIRPTFQCLSKLVLPPAPYLFAILLQKWETPWAKLFPLRLFLRLGAEFRYYPCPLVGIRFRKPVYCEIGHTIMNLLADFHNYQYTLPLIPGLVVHMEDKQTFIGFPRNRYDETIKALNSSIDHVLALAATFSVEADSHLVCIQSDDGNYHTQAINIRNKPRQVTGASFVVFNGALKTSSGLTAKLSIVEDGLMVQISSESMQSLRQSLRDMKDYVIACGAIGAELPEEVVHLRWVDDDRSVNIGVESPIDGMSMDGISSIRIHCGTDYMGDGFVIRWTEVYIVKSEEGHRSDPIDLGKVSDSVARACCLALTSHLHELFSSGLSRIGLRVTLDSEDVGYEIGAGGERLSHRFMNDLDSELVPAIHGAASPSQGGPIVLELIFHILQQ